MRISSRGDYGVRALIELAHHYQRGTLQSSEIAARRCIPEPYLDQLLTSLRRSGFIRSVRGPQGGHSLLRDPDSITMLEVIEALEGPLSPIACLDEPGCTEGESCSQRSVWEEVRQSTVNILRAHSIGELATSERHPATGGRYYI